MQIQITFRNIDASSEIEALVLKEAARLDRCCPFQVAWCHVVIAQPHQRKQKGEPYQVRVSVQGPRGYLVAHQESEARAAHRNPIQAITSAFGTIRRRVHRAGRPRDRAGRGVSWQVDQKVAVWP